MNKIRLLAIIITLFNLFLLPEYLQAITQQERESSLLRARKSYAENQISLGKKAMANQEYQSAFSLYQNAVDALSKAELKSTLLYKEASYDLSQAAINIDLETIHQEQSDHINIAAHKERNKMITAVDDAWKLPAPTNFTTTSSITKESTIPIRDISAILHKIRNIKIATIDFSETPLREAIEQVKKKALLSDSLEEDPSKKGVDIVLAFDIQKIKSEPKITLALTDTPLEDVLKYIIQQANLKLKIEPYAIAIAPESELTESLTSKEYKVSPTFIDYFSKEKEKKPNLSIKEFLISQGVSFPQGAMAHYLPSNNILIVKNNQPNLDLVDSLVEASSDSSSNQVEIEARFLEVTQTHLKERGFDWLLGAFKLPFGSGINNGGGTVANQESYQNANYPIQNNNGTPVGTIAGGPPGAGSVTSGTRTGTAAINANALDTLLLGGPSGPAAGVLALAGVLTNPQFQVVLRAINQHKGVELLSSPKVTVSSGRKATITIAREFPYPADYSPAQVPQSQGSGVNPAIPATPSSFKKRNIGVQLEAEPTLETDRSTIELSLSPQITEFQGFVNYGSPIFSQAPVLSSLGQTNSAASTAPVLLTQNTINQPVFSVRQVDTVVTLHDGQTVVLGGLMREDVQKVKDKVPIIGDIPLIGLLFRSSSEQKVKRNLIIFVTVHILHPK